MRPAGGGRTDNLRGVSAGHPRGIPTGIYADLSVRLVGSRAAATSVAENYVGLPM